jgi:hypothetical protein
MKLNNTTYNTSDKTSEGIDLRDQSLTNETDIDIINILTVISFLLFLFPLILFAIFSIKYGHPLIFIGSWILPVLLVKIPLNIQSKRKNWSWFDFRAKASRNDIYFDIFYCMLIAVSTTSILLSFIYAFLTLLSAISGGLLIHKIEHKKFENTILNGEANDSTF